jgi:hypothetical protein
MTKQYSTKHLQAGFDDFDTADYQPAKKSHLACYHSHPKLLVGGGHLYGGSCISPIITDADIYVGLDSGMRVQHYNPWERQTPVEQFLYPITDMSVPTSSKTFIALVDYLCNQLQQGKHIHAGCIGGHGRTGTLFSAIFKVLTDDKDAISTVRKLYCKKAVESSEQAAFLHKHFGIEKVEGYKSSSSHLLGYGYGGYGSSMKGITGSWPKSGGSEIKTAKSNTVFSDATKVWNCVNSSQNLFGTLL